MAGIIPGQTATQDDFPQVPNGQEHYGARTNSNGVFHQGFSDGTALRLQAQGSITAGYPCRINSNGTYSQNIPLTTPSSNIPALASGSYFVAAVKYSETEIIQAFRTNSTTVTVYSLKITGGNTVTTTQLGTLTVGNDLNNDNRYNELIHRNNNFYLVYGGFNTSISRNLYVSKFTYDGTTFTSVYRETGTNILDVQNSYGARVYSADFLTDTRIIIYARAGSSSNNTFVTFDDAGSSGSFNTALQNNLYTPGTETLVRKYSNTGFFAIGRYLLNTGGNRNIQYYTVASNGVISTTSSNSSSNLSFNSNRPTIDMKVLSSTRLAVFNGMSNSSTFIRVFDIETTNFTVTERSELQISAVRLNNSRKNENDLVINSDNTFRYFGNSRVVTGNLNISGTTISSNVSNAINGITGQFAISSIPAQLPLLTTSTQTRTYRSTFGDPQSEFHGVAPSAVTAGSNGFLTVQGAVDVASGAVYVSSSAVKDVEAGKYYYLDYQTTTAGTSWLQETTYNDDQKAAIGLSANKIFLL